MRFKTSPLVKDIATEIEGLLQIHCFKVDPFFEKPYEPSPSASAKAGWEPETRANQRSLSANIKPKKRVAALFRTPMPALPVVAEAGMTADAPQSLPHVGNADQPLAQQQPAAAVVMDNA